MQITKRHYVVVDRYIYLSIPARVRFQTTIPVAKPAAMCVIRSTISSDIYTIIGTTTVDKKCDKTLVFRKSGTYSVTIDLQHGSMRKGSQIYTIHAFKS